MAKGPVATRETPPKAASRCRESQHSEAIQDSAALKTSRDNQAAENWA